MAKREIKTSLKLEGEHEFRRAMDNASDAIKVLNSEQKLAEAQFKLTGDAEQFLTDKTEILRKKIEEQQKAVNAAQKAVTALKEKGVAPNSKAMQDWTRKLNDSKAYLTRLQSDLNSTEKQLQETGDAFEGAGDSAEEYKGKIDKVAGGINFQNTISSLDSIQGKLNSALNSVVSVTQKILAAEKQASDWADNLITSATKAGMDVETYQSWAYAAQFVDTEVDDIIGAQDKLLKKLSESSEETSKTFNRLGIETKDATGNMRDYHSVFWETIDALGKSTDAYGDNLDDVQKDAVAQELFGKSYRELLPLINSGSTVWFKLAQEAEQYAVVSEANVQKLGELNDAIVKFNADFEATKTTFQAELAPAFTEVYTAFDGMIQAFSEWLKSEDGQKALDKLSGAIAGLVTSFSEDDFKGLVEGAAGAIGLLNSVLTWIKDHGWAIVNTLVAMKGAVVGMAVTKSMLQFLQLIKGIQWLNVAKGAKALGDAAGGSAAAGKSGILAKALTATGKVAAPAAAFGVAAVGVTPIPSMIIDKMATERDWGKLKEDEEKIEETLQRAEDLHIAGLGKMLKEFDDALNSEGEFGGTDIGRIKSVFEKNADSILNLLPYIDFWDYVKDDVNIEDGLSKDDIEKIFNLDLLGSDWEELARDVVTGLTKTIEDSEGEARDVGAGLGGAIDEGFREELDIESPSKVMEQRGLMITAGLKAGIEAGAAEVIAAAAALASSVQQTLAGAQIMGYGAAMGRAVYSRPSYSGAGGGSGTGIINNVINVDGRQIAAAMTPYVSQNMSMSLRSER